jgi:hypothetical protein
VVGRCSTADCGAVNPELRPPPGRRDTALVGAAQTLTRPKYIQNTKYTYLYFAHIETGSVRLDYYVQLITAVVVRPPSLGYLRASVPRERPLTGSSRGRRGLPHQAKAAFIHHSITAQPHQTFHSNHFKLALLYQRTSVAKALHPPRNRTNVTYGVGERCRGGRKPSSGNGARASM